MTNIENIYDFSFTGASMKFHDFIRLASIVEEHGLNLAQETPDPGSIMRRSNSRTNKREFRELLKRYKLLTPIQQSLLLSLDVSGQRHLALLGICKSHTFIRDFIIEVVILFSKILYPYLPYAKDT